MNGFIEQTTVPALKVSDEKDLYKITVAAPGIHKNDFLLKTIRDELIIKILNDRKQIVQKDPVSKKKDHCDFSCSIILPREVKQSMIAAHLDEGALSIYLPKTSKCPDLKTTIFSNYK
ncbi:Hsp20/alpha crystallin family protein [Niabella beijingensis]|nr:Hsp20/alpha crystallin family protein [Niabella beijingensis]MBZ4191623.1 Hsp20/alpha crystallin family protein [Niabella beijingensis]